MRSVRLKDVASVTVSNVDKKAVDGETPVRVCNYVDVYYHDRIGAGLPFMEATASPAQVRAFGLRGGEVLITKDSELAEDIAVPALVPERLDGVVCGYHLAVIRGDGAHVDPAFLFWLMAGDRARSYFTTEASGVTRFGLRTDSIKNLPVDLPPIEEQRRIADFLDAETARIDALIAKRHRQIELLTERHQAVRESALTLPKADRVPLRRWALSIDQGVSPIAESRRAEADEWAVLKLSSVKRGRFHPEEHKVVADAAVIKDAPRPEIGDLLVTRANTPGLVGDVCAVVEHVDHLVLSDLIYRVRLNPAAADARFVAEALLTHGARHHLSSLARGSSQSMVKLRSEDILDCVVPVVPVSQQLAIVGGLSGEQRLLDGSIGALRRQIELLRERRQALITAAVTGEFVVP